MRVVQIEIMASDTLNDICFPAFQNMRNSAKVYSSFDWVFHDHSNGLNFLEHHVFCNISEGLWSIQIFKFLEILHCFEEHWLDVMKSKSWEEKERTLWKCLPSSVSDLGIYILLCEFLSWNIFTGRSVRLHSNSDPFLPSRQAAESSAVRKARKMLPSGWSEIEAVLYLNTWAASVYPLCGGTASSFVLFSRRHARCRRRCWGELLDLFPDRKVGWVMLPMLLGFSRINALSLQEYIPRLLSSVFVFHPGNSSALWFQTHFSGSPKQGVFLMPS